MGSVLKRPVHSNSKECVVVQLQQHHYQTEHAVNLKAKMKG